jgi:hypothetical protein
MIACWKSSKALKHKTLPVRQYYQELNIFLREKTALHQWDNFLLPSDLSVQVNL